MSWSLKNLKVDFELLNPGSCCFCSKPHSSRNRRWSIRLGRARCPLCAKQALYAPTGERLAVGIQPEEGAGGQAEKGKVTDPSTDHFWNWMRTSRISNTSFRSDSMRQDSDSQRFSFELVALHELNECLAASFLAFLPSQEGTVSSTLSQRL